MLARKNILVTIVEANDYIGGRMRSFDFEGVRLEDGATWV